MIPLAECRRIIEQVAHKRQLQLEDVLGRERTRKAVIARRIAARRLFKAAVPVCEIARQLKRNHATIQYYLGRIHRERPITKRTAWREHPL